MPAKRHQRIPSVRVRRADRAQKEDLSGPWLHQRGVAAEGLCTGPVSVQSFEDIHYPRFQRKNYAWFRGLHRPLENLTYVILILDKSKKF